MSAAVIIVIFGNKDQFTLSNVKEELFVDEAYNNNAYELTATYKDGTIVVTIYDSEYNENQIEDFVLTKKTA